MSLTIAPKDVQAMFGNSYPTATKMIRALKDAFKKGDHQVVTLNEFCSYYGVPEDEALKKLGRKK